jgi:hypothetical protein
MPGGGLVQEQRVRAPEGGQSEIRAPLLRAGEVLDGDVLALGQIDH